MRATWWSPAHRIGVRRMLDGALIVLVLATFLRWSDAEFFLDLLWIVLAIGTFSFGFRTTVLRIVLVMIVNLAHLVLTATSAGEPLELEILEFTDWPLVMIVCFIVALMADRVTNAARRYAALYRQASERLVTAHEDERARLARDLHDGVGQTLTAALLTLDAASVSLGSGDPALSQAPDERSTEARAGIGRARSLVAAALDEAREVAAELRPPRIQEVGLGAAIKALAGSAGAPVIVQFPARRLPPGLLDPARQIDTYRIVQEAVSNAARHGRAAHIWIKAWVGPDFLKIEVGDDGIGFERPAVPSGLGLVGMEERANILGGRLEVRSSVGSGTRITAIIPRRPPDEPRSNPVDVARRMKVGAS